MSESRPRQTSHLYVACFALVLVHGYRYASRLAEVIERTRRTLESHRLMPGLSPMDTHGRSLIRTEGRDALATRYDPQLVSRDEVASATRIVVDGDGRTAWTSLD